MTANEVALPRILLLTVAAATWTVDDTAQAQTPPNDVIVAEALFKDAKRLMDEGKIPEACRRFGESFRFDPRAGHAAQFGCLPRAGRKDGHGVV